MLSENGDDRAPDHSTMNIQNGRQTDHVASLLIGVVVWTGENHTKTKSFFKTEQNSSAFV